MPKLHDPIQEGVLDGPNGANGNGSDDPDEYAPKRRFMLWREEVWLYWVRVGFLLVSALGSFSVISIYMWHLTAPQTWRWLCDADISKLKDLAITIIVGLIMSATTTYFFKKNMK